MTKHVLTVDGHLLEVFFKFLNMIPDDHMGRSPLIPMEAEVAKEFLRPEVHEALDNLLKNLELSAQAQINALGNNTSQEAVIQVSIAKNLTTEIARYKGIVKMSLFPGEGDAHPDRVYEVPSAILDFLKMKSVNEFLITLISSTQKFQDILNTLRVYFSEENRTLEEYFYDEGIYYSPEVINEELKYSGYHKVYLETLKVNNDDEFERDRIQGSHGTSILLLDEDDMVILVEQYRAGVGGNSLEIIAGKIDEGESSYEAIVRETLEETGYTPKNIQLLSHQFHPSVMSTSTVDIFIGEIDKSIPRVSHDRPEGSDEYLRVLHLPISQVQNLINSGAIKDSKTILALMMMNNAMLQTSVNRFKGIIENHKSANKSR